MYNVLECNSNPYHFFKMEDISSTIGTRLHLCIDCEQIVKMIKASSKFIHLPQLEGFFGYNLYSRKIP